MASTVVIELPSFGAGTFGRAWFEGMIPRANQAVLDCGLIVVAAMKEKLKQPGHGRWYRVKGTQVSINKYRKSKGAYVRGGAVFANKGRQLQRTRTFTANFKGTGPHRASAPGEPPASDFGQYAASWDISALRQSGFVSEVGVGSELWSTRGRRLEYGGGSVRGGYIAPRPHVRPVMEEVRFRVQQRLEQL